jgi:hypothetical protein
MKVNNITVIPPEVNLVSSTIISSKTGGLDSREKSMVALAFISFGFFVLLVLYSMCCDDGKNAKSRNVDQEVDSDYDEIVDPTDAQRAQPNTSSKKLVEYEGGHPDG